MPLGAIETTEDSGNAPNARSTFARRAINPVKVADAQAYWASTKEALSRPAAEFPRTGNGQALPRLTELKQVRPTIASVVEWPRGPR